MSSNEFDGSLALVTGATAGIGRAIALRLARGGAEVIVHGRDPDRGAETVADIERAGGRARFLASDLVDPESVERLAAAAAEVEVLVNNAGFSWFGPSAELGSDRLDDMFACNVKSAYLLVAALGPRMAARGKGSIVTISSAGGQIGLPSGAAYGATKAALNELTRSWAAEFGASGVRVNAVAAGPTYTRPEGRELAEEFGATTPLKRVAEPEEIAEVVAFLASGRASFVTGAIVAADGGRTAV
jgi:NAD(P)-dependent dehydrogenase (short-subunit alcohol dehydrogenase family)